MSIDTLTCRLAGTFTNRSIWRRDLRAALAVCSEIFSDSGITAQWESSTISDTTETQQQQQPSNHGVGGLLLPSRHVKRFGLINVNRLRTIYTQSALIGKHQYRSILLLLGTKFILVWFSNFTTDTTKLLCQFTRRSEK